MVDGKKENKYRAKLDAKTRQFVLRSIGHFKSSRWIVDELKRVYSVEVTEDSIDSHYRHKARYQKQIAKYRDQYSAEFQDIPLMNQRFVVEEVWGFVKAAQAKGDASGTAALLKQWMELSGMKSPEQSVVTHQGSVSYHNTLEVIAGQAQAPPIEIESSDPQNILPQAVRKRITTNQSQAKA